jgi:protein involved in polysaccharide export with SLBB domain
MTRFFTAISWRAILLIIAPLLLSCSGSHGPGLVVTEHIPLPKFIPPQPQDMPEYLIDFGDLLDIKFFNNERFNDSVKVRPDGRITLERMGDLLVVGRTPTEVDSMITRVYASIIKDPDVTVFVREFGQVDFYVMGEVNRPGNYPFHGNITAAQAVAIAGGPSREAKMTSVLIIRIDNDQLVAARWDLDNLLDGHLIGGIPAVRPLDIIFVPRTFISKVGSFLNTNLPAILSPLDLAVRGYYYKRVLSGDANTNTGF